MSNRDSIISAHEQLLMAIQNESRRFQEYYVWLEKAMPPLFFEEVSQNKIMLIAHNLMGFHLQDYFSTIHLKNAAIALCPDTPDADLRILSHYAMYGIKNYQCYISRGPPPAPAQTQGLTGNLRIAILYLTEAVETVENPFPLEDRDKLRELVKEKIPEITDSEFNHLLKGINNRFLRSLSLERVVLALQMFWRAKTRDNCQYEVRYNEDWESNGAPSMQIVLAWRNTPKNNFLYKLARTIHRHGLMMRRVNATYIDPYSRQNILIMSLALHGSNGQAVWDVAEIPDFLRELATVKYFSKEDLIEKQLVAPGTITGNTGNLLRAMKFFIHQALVHVDPNLYTVENVEEGLCRHPELTLQILEAFKYRFDPDYRDPEKYEKSRTNFLSDLSKIDTGQEELDIRRKNILRMGLSFVTHTLKTNFYRLNYTAMSFRLDPHYLDDIPFERGKKFPEMPFGIFYIFGMNFFGFHIRFKELARGGLRTVLPQQLEHLFQERNNVFTECYNLALTQQFKNKDIPEGGAKGIIFLRPTDKIASEATILRNELLSSKILPEEIEKKIAIFKEEQTIEYLYQAQRAYIEALLSLVDCDSSGKLRARYIIDYWEKPEYLYLGPDENMRDEMIQWIADYSKAIGYKPGTAFITSKPRAGINHKEYGVTSLGMTVYLDTLLRHIHIDPTKDTFTVKMSGGPDGDVAGNQIQYLAKYYPKTAKILTLTDVSGSIFDPEGLDFDELDNLFRQGKPIRSYPPAKLHRGGFLVDKFSKRSAAAFAQQNLCWRKTDKKLEEEWISGFEMNHLLRHNVNQTVADVFIPAGGRPRTLNERNFTEFLDPRGKPTAQVIIEGANLYITPRARQLLEKLGVLIVKDSSANKTGVICSSFEVLCGLTLGDELFRQNKDQLVKEILERLQKYARDEAQTLLKAHAKTGEPLTEISDKISQAINAYTYQILNFLDSVPLPEDPQSPLIQTFFDYCLPTLKEKYHVELMREIPEHHKKAIIACHLAAGLVYRRGVDWVPSIVDILPALIQK